MQIADQAMGSFGGAADRARMAMSQRTISDGDPPPSDDPAADTRSASAVRIELSPEAQRALGGGGLSQVAAQTMSFGLTGNPDGTVTTVGEVVVIGQKKTLFTVAISLPEPPIYTPIHDELEPIIDDLPTPPLTPCQQETLKDRAALEAQKILDSLDKNKEWGMYLIQDPDGSIRGVGPISGNQTELVWNASVAELGITSWDQLVGLVHTHPMDGPRDSLARQFSGKDVNVTRTFLQGGANSNFRQYISVGGQLVQFGKDAREGSTSSDKVTGQGCD
jgi:hypothetical protein